MAAHPCDPGVRQGRTVISARIRNWESSGRGIVLPILRAEPRLRPRGRNVEPAWLMLEARIRTIKCADWYSATISKWR